MVASRTTHLSQAPRRSASACDPPCGVRFLMVRLRKTMLLTLSTPNSARPRVLGLRLLLFVPEITVPLRSWPCKVMVLLRLR